MNGYDLYRYFRKHSDLEFSNMRNDYLKTLNDYMQEIKSKGEILTEKEKKLILKVENEMTRRSNFRWFIFSLIVIASILMWIFPGIAVFYFFIPPLYILFDIIFLIFTRNNT